MAWLLAISDGNIISNYLSTMHQIDRTLQELELNSGMNGEYENEYEFNGNGEFEQAFEQSFGQEATYGNNETFEMGQNPELEMAYQLLEISNEYELNQFLGDLINKAVATVKNAPSNFVNSKPGQAVGQYLVKVGTQTLPALAEKKGGQLGGDQGQKYGQGYGQQAGQTAGRFVGQALGSRVGLGGVGGYIGNAAGGYLGNKAGGFIGKQAGNFAGSNAGKWIGTKAGNFIASNAKRVFNLELEALSPENQELEIARSYVRFANDLVRQASQVVRQNPYLSLSELGKQAITASASQHAPGLLTGNQGAALRAMNGSANSGTWVRQGKNLIVYGV